MTYQLTQHFTKKEINKLINKKMYKKNVQIIRLSCTIPCPYKDDPMDPLSGPIITFRDKHLFSIISEFLNSSDSFPVCCDGLVEESGTIKEISIFGFMILRILER